METLPNWMNPQPIPDAEAVPRHNRRRRSSSARRALSSFTRLLERMLALDACGGGFLQSVDARAKLIGFAGLLVAVSFVHTPLALAACLAGCLVCATVSRVPVRRFLDWLPAPVLFTAVIAAPATLNLITEGRPVLALPYGLAVTDSGLFTAGRLVLRVTACVSVVALLALTTRRHRLLQGLRGLGVPRVFVVVLTMMERYLEVIVRAAEQVHLSRISRTVSPRGLRDEHAWVAAGMGSLFRRSRSLAESVHLAMIARGFTGDHHTLSEDRFGVREVAFLVGIAGFAGLLLILGQVT